MSNETDIPMAISTKEMLRINREYLPGQVARQLIQTLRFIAKQDGYTGESTFHLISDYLTDDDLHAGLMEMGEHDPDWMSRNLPESVFEAWEERNKA